MPSLQAAVGQGDPPIPLRFGQGSRTQLLDCDHANRNADDEIETGCFTGYATNPTGDCSAYGNGDLPPKDYFNDPNAQLHRRRERRHRPGQVRAGLGTTVRDAGLRFAPQQLGALPVGQHDSAPDRLAVCRPHRHGHRSVQRRRRRAGADPEVRRVLRHRLEHRLECMQRRQRATSRLRPGSPFDTKADDLGTLRELRCNDQQR